MNDEFEDRKANCLNSLASELRTASTLAHDWKFDFDHIQDFVVAGHFIALVEIGEGILQLARLENTSNAKILMRTMLETLVLLRAASVSGDEAKSQLMDFEHTELKLLRQAKLGNKFIRGTFGELDIDAAHKATEDRLKSLRAQGVKKSAPIQTRFHNYLGKEEYDGIYASLSQQSHAGLGAVVERSVIVENENSQLQLVGFKRPKISMLEGVVETTASLVVDAKNIVSAFVQQEENTGPI